MAFQITNDASEILLQEHLPFPTEKIQSASLIEETQQISYDFGIGSFREFYFDGYHIGFGGANIFENLHVAVDDHQPFVSLLFLIHGHFETRIEGLSSMSGKRRFLSLEHNLMYTPNTEENIDVRKQQGLEIVSLSISKERFLELTMNNGRVMENMADMVAGGKAIFLNKKSNQPITSRMMMILDDIKHCQFNGGSKKLFLQSKVLELLALQCEQHERAQELKIATFSLSATDKEKIYHARDLLISHLEEPPSLQQLSRMAGLNEFKLKNGFKHVFSNTVFGYLNDHRMQHARKLILSQQQSLSEIADKLGFSSIQHFSSAFRKKFGVSPSKMNN